MSLRDEVLSSKPKSETVTVAGKQFLLIGKSKLERSKLFAKCRRKDGSINGDKLESMLLSACVCDPQTQKQLFDESEFSAWDDVDSSLTGPLFAEVMRICGMDKQDLSPKDSDSTDN